jgi:hypothetical protein
MHVFEVIAYASIVNWEYQHKDESRQMEAENLKPTGSGAPQLRCIASVT